METRKKQRFFPILAFVVTVLVSMPSISTAGPGGSLKGSVTISGNEANKVLNEGGKSGGAKVLGIFGGGGGQGMRDAELLIQGVNVVGTEIDANIAISDNKTSDVVNKGARVNVQGVSVRR